MTSARRQRCSPFWPRHAEWTPTAYTRPCLPTPREMQTSRHPSSSLDSQRLRERAGRARMGDVGERERDIACISTIAEEVNSSLTSVTI
mmetsp:Transcript_14700/g.37211  ORF Transcript_14700/g.37211 Transcript_14700/m.37211 type:complete len:89 (+) Transcript_14700:1280-1546(+)